MASSDATATVAVVLDDQVSGPAEAAATALSRLRTSIDSDTRALGEMQRAMKTLQAASTPNVAAVDTLTKRIQVQRDKIAAAQADYVSGGGTFARVPKPPKPMRVPAPIVDPPKVDDVKPPEVKPPKPPPKPDPTSWERLRDAVRQIPGPLGQVISFGEKVIKTLGVSALVAGWLALGAAVATVLSKMAKYAIAAAEARKEQFNQLDGLSRMRNMFTVAYGLASEKAETLQANIDAVSRKVSIGSDKVQDYQTQLYNAGLRGANLASALEGVSVAASGGGDAVAQHYAQWAAYIGLTGGSVDKLTTKIKNQYGGVVSRKMRELGVQQLKLKENQDRMFGSAVDTSGLDRATQAYNKLFDDSTASGKELKRLFGTIMQPFIDAQAVAQHAMKNTVQSTIIGILLVELAWEKLKLALRSSFSGSGLDKWFREFNLLASPIGDTAAKIVVAADAVIGLKRIITETNWAELGQSIYDGITGPLSHLKEWFTNLAIDTKDTTALTWGIQSPSKVFAGFGRNIAEGLALGIKSGQPQSQDAIDGLVSMPRTPEAPIPAPTGGAPRAGAAITIGEITVNATGGDKSNAASIAKDIRRELEDILEGVAIQLGTMGGASPA